MANNNYPLDTVPRYIFLDITIDGDDFSYLLSSFNEKGFVLISTYR